MGAGYNQSNSNAQNVSFNKNESHFGSTGSTGLSPAQILAAYQNYLPATLTAIGQGNLQQLLPGGAGTAATAAGSALQRSQNPEYYSAIGSGTSGAAQGNDAAARMLNAINLTGLSPGEYNATERGVNQYNTGTGNAGLVNPMNTISNAMNFGGAFNNKIGIMGNALGANASNIGAAANIAGAASPNTSGFNPIAMALGGLGFGANYINPITSVSKQSSSGGGSGWGISMGNQVGSSQGASASGGDGSMCCFIFMESYHGKMPTCIRKIRDKYYRQHPRIANGYKRMAKWLVPLMQRSKIIRSIVWYSMVNPATKYAMSLHCGYNKRISHFWLRTWAVIGG